MEKKEVRARQLKCKECGRKFTTARVTYTPKFCSKPCYWQSTKNPETVRYEDYQAMRKNAKDLFRVMLPFLGFVAVLIAIAFYISRC